MLRPLRGLVVLDEIQRLPHLFRLLRVLVDRPGCHARFLVLGSASMSLLRQASESLAGRIATHRLGGFALTEVGEENADRRWVRGGFPRAYLANDDNRSRRWRDAFLATFLERDAPQLGIGVPSPTLRRFWMMLAHNHGQLWNASALGRAFGVADTTVRRYLDALSATYMVWQLPPWHENVRKRQVKSPKVYLADSGLLHALLGLSTARDVLGHPICGFSWEGFAIQQVLWQLNARDTEAYFWATHAGAELDLFVIRGGARRGVEFQRSEAPRLTRSMRIAIEDLKLDRLDVVHAGQKSWPLGERAYATSLHRMSLDLPPLP